MKIKTQILLLCCSLLATTGAFADSNRSSSKAGIKGVSFKRVHSRINDLSAELEAMKLDIQNRLNVLQDQLNGMNGGNNTDMSAEIAQIKQDIGILQANLTALQNSLATGCPDGSALRAINPDGSVTCQTMASDTGSAGPMNRQVVMVPATVDVFSSNQATANCEPGLEVTGGGYEIPPGYDTSNIMVTQNRPEGSGWIVEVQNVGYSTVQFSSYAICVSN